MKKIVTVFFKKNQSRFKLSLMTLGKLYIRNKSPFQIRTLNGPECVYKAMDHMKYVDK